MDDLRLRELIRPLANAIAPSKSLNAQRKVQEGFRDDGMIESGVIVGALPLQRIDVFVPGGHAPGLHDVRLFIPESSRGVRIAMVSSSNVTSTFSVSVQVNGVTIANGAIRNGTDKSTGVMNMNLPAGSIVTVQLETSVPQAVTVSLFYRPTED